jgi:biotin-[acetyl-CoA-carboxylase] ligase BirA-like protein
MLIFTDSTNFASRIFPQIKRWQSVNAETQDEKMKPLLDSIYTSGAAWISEIESASSAKNLLLVEHAQQSQYDLLIDLLRSGKNMPDKTFCLAGSGARFHGLHGREWCSPPGNIYLAVCLRPNRRIEHYAPGFTILTAVSVIETIDKLTGLENRAGTKWVNDIVIDGVKVCGVLAHTQTEGDTVSAAVLGIGLNVETTPEILPTSSVPKAGSLSDFTDDPGTVSQATLLPVLIERLSENYQNLLDGKYAERLDIYRNRSVVIGREVEIYPDTPHDEKSSVIAGKVSGIGENLELFLEGHKEPITKGRLVLKSL